MKLCKSCKHAVMPTPQSQQYYGQAVYNYPMCGHPGATRDSVYGNYEIACIDARGTGQMGATNKTICGPEAKLFEQAPEPELFVPGPYVFVPTEKPPKISLIDRFLSSIGL